MSHIVFIEASDTGAGEEACKSAKKEGNTVTLITRDSTRFTSKFKEWVDTFIECDTNNEKSVVDQLINLSSKHSIDGITTTADFYVPIAAYAANWFHLPSIDYEGSLNARYKHRTRICVQEKCPTFNPNFVICNSLKQINQLDICFPSVVKAIHLNDGLGIKMVHSKDELLHTSQQIFKMNHPLQQHIENPCLLIEDFIEAPEISAEVVCIPGQKPILLGITDKRLTGIERGVFVEVGHIFPSYEEDHKRVEEASSSILQALGIDCGVMHIEYKITNDSLILMEVNPRLAGGGIMYLIKIAMGIDPTKIVNDIALGNSINIKQKKELGAAIAAFWTNKSGIYGGLENVDELSNIYGVEKIIERLKVGDKTKLPICNGDIIGTVIASASTANDAYKIAKSVAEQAKFIIKT